eukprot:GHVR01076700.1.p1 GENE.GHVR01076700.1~~GHVR01076700.1.p1  ORF type:complete len:389 (+),score=87.48 GHVR01076700.1:60-1226(+)
MLSLIFRYLILGAYLISGKQVHILTKETISDFFEIHENTLLTFYSPNCRYCQSLDPELKKIAQKLDQVVGVAKVDGTTDQSLMEEFGVSGYPTIKFIQKGKVYDYEGENTSSGILVWLESMVGQSWVDISDVSALDQELPTFGLPLVILYSNNISNNNSSSDSSSDSSDDSSSSGDSIMAKAFKELSEKRRIRGRFLLLKGYEEEKIELRRSDGVVETFTATDILDESVSESLFEFFRFYSVPHVGSLDDTSHETYYHRSSDKDHDVMVWLAFDNKFYGKDVVKLEGLEGLLNKMADLFPRYDFVWLDSEAYGEHVLEHLAITKYPGIAAVKDNAFRYIWMREEEDDTALNEKDVTSMISLLEKVSDGTATPFVKSEVPPKNNKYDYF